MSALAYLELRVSRKFAEAAAARSPELPDLDLGEWFSGDAAPPVALFPRGRWITCPNRRLITLMIIDRALDSDLNAEQWAEVALLMQYGGRERVA